MPWRDGSRTVLEDGLDVEPIFGELCDERERIKAGEKKMDGEERKGGGELDSKKR